MALYKYPGYETGQGLDNETGESWGGTNKQILGAKPPIFPYICPSRFPGSTVQPLACFMPWILISLIALIRPYLFGWFCLILFCPFEFCKRGQYRLWYQECTGSWDRSCSQFLRHNYRSAAQSSAYHPKNPFPCQDLFMRWRIAWSLYVTRRKPRDDAVEKQTCKIKKVAKYSVATLERHMFRDSSFVSCDSPTARTEKRAPKWSPEILRENMRTVKDKARFVWNKFVHTNCFKAIRLTLDTQKFDFDFKKHKYLEILGFYLQETMHPGI